MTTLRAEMSGRGMIRLVYRGESVRSSFAESKDFRRAAKILGLPVAQIQEFVESVKKGGSMEVEIRRAVPVCDRFIVRPMYSAGGVEVKSFDEALQKTDLPPDSQPVITWHGREAVCALDVDEIAGRVLLAQIKPTPAYAWVTHGGGLRAIYFAADGWAAEEIAALGAVWCRTYDPAAKTELLSHTRHPMYRRGDKTAGAVIKRTQTIDAVGWLDERQVDDAIVAEWLAENGWHRGQTLPHDCCPIAPIPHHRPCVFVGDQGIYCHLCSARGRQLRGHRPGFVPYSDLVGRPAPSLLRLAVDVCTHYEQVQHYVPISRAEYSALLKLRHGIDDKRIPAALVDRDLLRIGNCWRSASGEFLDPRHLMATIAGLPATWRQVDGEYAPVKEIVERFRQPVDLRNYGYPSLQPVYGVSFCQQKTTPSVVLPTPALRHHPETWPQIRQAMPLRRAWEIIQEIFPGICRRLIYLLLAAKGAAESQSGMPQIIYIEGPSGAGKSLSVHIAAAIAGDIALEASYRDDLDHILRSIAEAGAVGSYCVFNECAKYVKSSAEFSFLLNLSPYQMYHRLYVGPVPVGTLPVIVLTDTQIPDLLVTDRQLARRIVGVRVNQPKTWQDSMAATGLNAVQTLRRLRPDVAAACDTILHAVSVHLLTKYTTFEQIARRLRFGRLMDRVDFADHLERLRRLVRILATRPVEHKRGRGMRAIREDDVEVAEIWSELHDPGVWTSWSRANVEDWRLVFGVPYDLQCVIKPHGRIVYIGWRKSDGEWYPLELVTES